MNTDKEKQENAPIPIITETEGNLCNTMKDEMSKFSKAYTEFAIKHHEDFRYVKIFRPTPSEPYCFDMQTHSNDAESIKKCVELTNLFSETISKYSNHILGFCFELNESPKYYRVWYIIKEF